MIQNQVAAAFPSHPRRQNWAEDDRGDDNIALCRTCLDNHYTYCTRCDRIISNYNACYDEDENDGSYCSACYGGSSKHCAIHLYNYKPELIFYGEGNTLIVESLSRLGRSTKDLIELIELLHQKEVQFVSLKEASTRAHPPGGSCSP